MLLYNLDLAIGVLNPYFKAISDTFKNSLSYKPYASITIFLSSLLNGSLLFLKTLSSSPLSMKSIAVLSKPIL